MAIISGCIVTGNYDGDHGAAGPDDQAKAESVDSCPTIHSAFNFLLFGSEQAKAESLDSWPALHGLSK